MVVAALVAVAQVMRVLVSQLVVLGSMAFSNLVPAMNKILVFRGTEITPNIKCRMFTVFLNYLRL